MNNLWLKFIYNKKIFKSRMLQKNTVLFFVFSTVFFSALKYRSFKTLINFASFIGNKQLNMLIFTCHCDSGFIEFEYIIGLLEQLLGVLGTDVGKGADVIFIDDVGRPLG